MCAALLLAALGAAHAQQAERLRVVGWLTSAAEPSSRERNFAESLRALGWNEGQNLRIEYRRAANDSSRLAAMAEELVRARVDVIVTQSTPAAQAAKNATRTIPIVISSADPVGTGFVESLARPGGNITGISMMMPELAGKRLELLRDFLPSLKRVAFLAHGGDPAHRRFVEQTREAARKLGVQLQVLVIEKEEQFDGAFAAMVRENADAVILQPLFVNTLYAGPRLAELAVKHRLPAVSDGVGFADQGGLLFYGPDVRAFYPRIATYVDRVLKGADPATMPIEQPQKFEMILNLKTAQKLGVGVPRSLLLRADRVIE